jgi:quercetin dioxygenase-like cupin family protein
VTTEGAEESSGAAPRLTAVEPGEGRSGQLVPGVGVVFKLAAAETGGAFSIVEHPFDVGALVPPHRHTREDECSMVLEGEIGFRSEDQEVVLGAGSYIIKPRGETHTMWIAGAVPARMVEIISPAGFESFFSELADMTAAGPPEDGAVAELAGRYELPFEEPEWLADVIARYNLTPPG